MTNTDTIALADIADILMDSFDWCGDTPADADAMATFFRDWCDRNGNAYDVVDLVWFDYLYGILSPDDICRYLFSIGVPNSNPLLMPA